MALDDTLDAAVLRRRSSPFRRRSFRAGRTRHAVAAARRVDAACRARVTALGEAGFLKAAVPASYGGLHPALDVRTLCIAREILAFRDGLADFAFAMQGLGTGSITLFGSEELKRQYLPPVRDGKAIAAFALSEPEAGSDVAAMATTATARRQRMFASTAKRPGYPTAASPTITWCSRAPAKAPGAKRTLGLHGRCRHAGADRSPSASR